MTVEAFRLCPVPGCTVAVWGPIAIDNHCREHGGNRLGFPETDDDEWGQPRPSLEAATGESSPPVDRSLLETE